MPECNSSNHCCYSVQDLTWIEFIKRLKDTDMPIKEIQHYAKLRVLENPALHERMEMLIAHREALNVQISQLQEHMIKLDDIIDFCRQEIEDKTCR